MQLLAIVGLVGIAAGGLMFGEAGGGPAREGLEHRRWTASQITGACLMLLGIALLGGLCH